MNSIGPQDLPHTTRPDDLGGGVPGFTLPTPEDDDAPIVRRPAIPAPTAEPEAKRSAERRRRVGGTYLGVYVTQTTVYGSLVQDTASGIQVLRRFTRQRNAQPGETPDFGDLTAETASEDAADVTIQFGGNKTVGGNDLFLDSEFGDLGNLGDIDDTLSVSKQQSAPIVFELKDLFDECAALGYERPHTAFCVSQPAVNYVELIVPDEKKRDEKGKKSRSGVEAIVDEKAQPTLKRDRLLARLAEEYPGPFEKERVAFIPMTSREGVRRMLAVVPTPEDALVESLELLREQSGMRTVPFRAIDSEVSTLMGLARWAFAPDAHENTAIVRVSAENTLVILLQGNELHHQEHMLSVTTLDGPDTICSRVLLQQDVQGVGTVHQVIVLSEEREDELVRGFAAFYPDARVEALRRGLREHGVIPPGGEPALSARALPAVGAALRLVTERSKLSPFEDVNMLPKRLRRALPKLDFFIAWHTLVAAVLLFFMVLFFVGLYFAQQKQIADAQVALEAFPEEVSMSPQALQARIDSLQTVYIRITRTLNTIDSLLVGTDRWSRSMARLSRATASTGGTWVGQWNPQGGSVQLSGMATGRDQVVQFAERMNGSIDELRFHEIREYPVYSFTLTAPVPNELPEVARYLRDKAEVPVAKEPDPLGGALIDADVAIH
jgi:hypothetical protein